MNNKLKALLEFVESNPGMSAPEIRKHPKFPAIFKGRGVQKEIASLCMTEHVYYHNGGGKTEKRYYALPEGWSCQSCGRIKERTRKPSLHNPDYCGGCWKDRKKVIGIERNAMMDEWARVALIHAVNDRPPILYAV